MLSLYTSIKGAFCNVAHATRRFCLWYKKRRPARKVVNRKLAKAHSHRDNIAVNRKGRAGEQAVCATKVLLSKAASIPTNTAGNRTLMKIEIRSEGHTRKIMIIHLISRKGVNASITLKLVTHAANGRVRSTVKRAIAIMAPTAVQPTIERASRNIMVGPLAIGDSSRTQATTTKVA